MKNLLRAEFVCLTLCLLPTCFAGCKSGENSTLSANPANENQTSAILVSATGEDSAEPAITAAPDGSVYVVWVEHRPEKQGDVFIRHFDAEQKPLSEAVRVNPETGRATAWRGDPPTVKVGGDGRTVYVGWTARVDIAEGSANDLYLSVSRDNGKTFDAPVKVNDDSVPAVDGMHSLEIDRNGRVFFAWLDERYLKNETSSGEMPMNMSESASGEMKHKHGEPNREVYFAASLDGGKSFSANKKIAENVCPCCKTSMTAAPDGSRLYVAWRQVLDGDFRHIAVSSTTDGGNSFAPAVIVSDDRWQISGCPVSGAGMTVDAENNLKIVWFTAGEAGTPGIYFAESKDGGKSFSPRSLVSDKGATGTPIIAKDETGNYRIIFSATDGNAYSLTRQNASADFGESNEIKNAELTSAAVSKDKTTVAFIRKVDEKRTIFFLKQN